MFKASDIPEISVDDITDIVKDGLTHDNYGKVKNRSDIMNAWYGTNENFLGNTFLKEQIVRKSPIESNEDYNHRLKNFDLIPFEHKFFQGQQRIYDDNNVSRKFDSDFWNEKLRHFDDCGDDINTFMEDKVLFVNEVEGFGGIAFDIATNPDGTAINYEGKPVPYPYIIQAPELKYYKSWYGQLQLVVTCVQKDGVEEYRAFTPKYIYVFKDKASEPKRISHSFGETPFIILKGAPDPTSGFKVGRPRRWNVSNMYLTACELFYDLKLGSMFFGHPVPVMHEEAIKEISGVLDKDGKLVTSQVKSELGMIITYTGDEPPKDIFMQASMEGLQHITSVIFDNLIPLIYQQAQVRDKSQVVHNASGRSKQFDSVEEQALLSQTATDMEAIEKEIFRLMYKVRGEKGEPTIVYNKHHDLRTSDEVWTQFTEGLQYGKGTDGRIMIPKEVLEYQLMEYIRKVSAPKEVQDNLKAELTDFYDIKPITQQENNV